MNKFSEKHLLRDDLYWSAKYDSWDQRNDELYYYISLYKKKGQVFDIQDTFLVKTYSPGDVVKEDDILFAKIQRLAEAGISNI